MKTPFARSLVVFGLVMGSGSATRLPIRSARVPGGPTRMDMSVDLLIGGSNRGEIRKRMDAIHNWGPTQQNAVIGVGGPNCHLATLKITPVGNSYKVSPKYDSDYPDGVIIAKIVNDDPTQCDGVNIPLKYGHTAVWIVRYDNQQNPPYDGTSWVIDIGTTGGGAQLESPLPVKGWQTGSCGVTHPTNVGDRADIKRRAGQCDPNVDPKQKDALMRRVSQLKGQLTFNSVKSMLSPPSPDDGTLWFDCSLMCCYATAVF